MAKLAVPAAGTANGTDGAGAEGGRPAKSGGPVQTDVPKPKALRAVLWMRSGFTVRPTALFLRAEHQIVQAQLLRPRHLTHLSHCPLLLKHHGSLAAAQPHFSQA